jgi:hypothetical protein
MLNASGSAALAGETAADASQKRPAWAAIVFDPNTDRPQLRPLRSLRFIFGTSAADFDGANIAFGSDNITVKIPDWRVPANIRCSRALSPGGVNRVAHRVARLTASLPFRAMPLVAIRVRSAELYFSITIAISIEKACQKVRPELSGDPDSKALGAMA